MRISDIDRLAELAGICLFESVDASRTLVIKRKDVGLDSQPDDIVRKFATKACKSVKGVTLKCRASVRDLQFTFDAPTSEDKVEKVRKHLVKYLSNPKNIEESSLPPEQNAQSTDVAPQSSEFDAAGEEQPGAPDEIDSILQQIATSQLGVSFADEGSTEAPVQVTPSQILAALRAAYDLGIGQTDQQEPQTQGTPPQPTM